MTEQNSENKMIEGFTADLEERIAKVVIEIQVNAHKELRNRLVETIVDMGIEIKAEKIETVFNSISCNVSFKIPDFYRRVK